MNPNEMAKFKRKAPIPIVLLLLLYFLPGMVLESSFAELDQIVVDYSSELKKIRDLRRLDHDYQQQNQRLNELQQNKTQLFALIPPESALPGLIDRLHALAANSEVEVTNVSYVLSENYERLAVPGYDISMQLKSSYAGVRSFLAELENWSTPVLIKEVVMSDRQSFGLALRVLVK